MTKEKIFLGERIFWYNVVALLVLPGG